MVSNLAAAIGFENLGIDRLQNLRVREHAVLLRPSSDGEYVRVFQKQKIVAFALGNDALFHHFLHFERRTVTDSTKTANFKNSFAHLLYDKIPQSEWPVAKFTMKIKSKTMQFLVLLMTVVAVFAGTANAQKKKPTTTKKPVATVTNALEIREGADKVSIQLKNVSKFLYLLGGIAAALESTDRDAKAGKLSRAQLDTFAQQKQAVINSIRNLKAGLSALEIEFRTKNSIKPYLLHVQGVTTLAIESEDLATAGKFTDSGKVYLTVIEKLADALTAMP